jgi:hypothetical protein
LQKSKKTRQAFRYNNPIYRVVGSIKEETRREEDVGDSGSIKEEKRRKEDVGGSGSIKEEKKRRG